MTIGCDAWIGDGAIILPGVSIGDHAVIGAGSVVTRDVAAAETVVGNPARPLRSGDGAHVRSIDGRALTFQKWFMGATVLEVFFRPRRVIQDRHSTRAAT